MIPLLKDFIAEQERVGWQGANPAWIREHMIYELLALLKSGPLDKYKEAVKRLVDDLTDEDSQRIVMRTLQSKRVPT